MFIRNLVSTILVSYLTIPRNSYKKVESIDVKGDFWSLFQEPFFEKEFSFKSCINSIDH